MDNYPFIKILANEDLFLTGFENRSLTNLMKAILELMVNKCVEAKDWTLIFTLDDFKDLPNQRFINTSLEKLRKINLICFTDTNYTITEFLLSKIAESAKTYPDNSSWFGYLLIS